MEMCTEIPYRTIIYVFEYLGALIHLPSVKDGFAAPFCPCRAFGIQFWRLLLAGVAPDPDILEHRNAKIIQLGSYVWRSNPTPAQN